MKKYRLISLVAVMIMLSTTFAFANDETLDIEKAAIKSVQSSSGIKQVDNGLKMVQQMYYDIVSATNKSKLMLYLPIGSMSQYEIIKNMELLPLNAKTQFNKTNNTKETTQSLVRLSSYRSYITLLEAKSRVELQQKLVDNMEFNYNKSLTKLKSGTISKSEAQITEINYMKEKLILQKYQRDLKSSEMVLNKLMGEPITKQFDQYDDENINPSETIKPLKDYVDTALSSRSEILNANGNIDYLNKDQEYEKIYHPLPSDIYYDTSKYDLAEAHNNLDTAKINIEMDLTTGYKNLEVKMKDMDSTQKQFEYANTAYDNAAKSYKQGLLSESQLMDADKALTGAKVQLRVAELEAWFYQIRMDIASGIGPGIADQDKTLQSLGGSR